MTHLDKKPGKALVLYWAAKVLKMASEQLIAEMHFGSVRMISLSNVPIQDGQAGNLESTSRPITCAK